MARQKKENSSGYIKIVSGGAGTGSGGGGGGGEKTYPKILISEVKIAEKIGDKNIFVELYNPNDFRIDLTSWYIFRNESSFITKTLLEGKNIPSKDYFLITRKGSTWENQADVLFDDKTLNEDDKVTLKNPKGEIVDEISWSKIPFGFSFGRKWDFQTYGDFEIQIPTPKVKNQRDITPPEIEIISSPYILTNQTQATFFFQANEDAIFKCKLDKGDNKGSWGNCQSSQTQTYTNLTDGEYTFFRFRQQI